jgi:hypothetical protein
MHRWFYTLASVLVLATAGCTDEAIGTSPEDLDFVPATSEPDARPDKELRPDAWVEISPGVWERPRPEGGFERMGFGTEGFQFALDRAYRERAELLEAHRRRGVATEGERLSRNQELIDYLQASLSDAAKLGEREALPVTPPGGSRAAVPSESPSATSSGSVCAGNYTFDIDLDIWYIGGSVTSNVQWSEVGPFAPYYKTLHTYAYGWTHDHPGFMEDGDSYGPFRGSCCVSVSSYAHADGTWQPMLYGSAYISVTNGCAGFRFYEASNY